MSKVFRMSSSLKGFSDRARRAEPGRRVGQAFNLHTRKMAEGYVRVFKTGMEKNNFGLKKLSSITIDIKSRSGAKRISTALMRTGALVKSVQVRKVKNGWRGAPYGMHPSGFKAADLFRIHSRPVMILSSGKALSLGGGYFFRRVSRPGRNPWPKAKIRFMKQMQSYRKNLNSKLKREVMPK